MAGTDAVELLQNAADIQFVKRAVQMLIDEIAQIPLKGVALGLSVPNRHLQKNLGRMPLIAIRRHHQ